MAVWGGGGGGGRALDGGCEAGKGGRGGGGGGGGRAARTGALTDLTTTVAGSRAQGGGGESRREGAARRRHCPSTRRAFNGERRVGSWRGAAPGSLHRGSPQSGAPRCVAAGWCHGHPRMATGFGDRGVCAVWRGGEEGGGQEGRGGAERVVSRSGGTASRPRSPFPVVFWRPPPGQGAGAPPLDPRPGTRAGGGAAPVRPCQRRAGCRYAPARSGRQQPSATNPRHPPPLHTSLKEEGGGSVARQRARARARGVAGVGEAGVADAPVGRGA